MKSLGFPEFDFLEVHASKVQEHIPLAADCRRWDQEGSGLPGANPFISEATQRFIARFVLVGWQSLLVESSNFKFFGTLTFD